MTTELGSLTERWHRGWLLADHLTSEMTDGAAIVRLDWPSRKYEWVVLDESRVPSFAHTVASHPEAVWMSAPTITPDDTEVVLTNAGLTVNCRETFMRCSLADHPVASPPDGYEVSVSRTHVIEVRVTRLAQVVAKGYVAVVGEDAVPQQIQTSPEHRRRGLGSVVMGALVREAMADGAKHGLLLASEDGERLYTALGWETVGHVLIGKNGVKPT